VLGRRHCQPGRGQQAAAARNACPRSVRPLEPAGLVQAERGLCTSTGLLLALVTGQREHCRKIILTSKAGVEGIWIIWGIPDPCQLGWRYGGPESHQHARHG
jgi:hypothetical protein